MAKKKPKVDIIFCPGCGVMIALIFPLAIHKPGCSYGKI